MATVEKRIETLEKQDPKLTGQALLDSLWRKFWKANPALAARVLKQQQDDQTHQKKGGDDATH